MASKESTQRRAQRVRRQLKKVAGDRLRLSVYRSSKNIYAQIIDDAAGKTLVSTSDLVLKPKGTKTERAKAVGLEIAKLAKEKKISAVRFDRGARKYHGRIAALADAAREGGLTF